MSETTSSVNRPEPRASDATGAEAATTDLTEHAHAEAVLTANQWALRESETRFRELADNISQFAWTADPSGRRYWYNKRWYDYTGTTLEEVQGWGWQKLHHPDHIDRVVQRMRQSFETGTPWEDTFPLRGRDGNYRWFLSLALPIRNEAGDIIRWFGTNTDVTRQIEAEQALRELNETLEQRVEAETRERFHLWNASQDLLVVMDMKGKYLSVNPAWTATLGWSETDLLGKTSQWCVHPDDREKTRAEINHLATGRKTLRFDNRFQHHDGSYRWISWKAVPERERIYATGRDVTDLKAAENRLRETARELAQVSRRTTLATMTASIAHEVSQPLAAIAINAKAGLRSLQKPEPDLGAVQSALEQIVQDSHCASDILVNIRAMFRKDGKEAISLNVNDLLRDVLALARVEIESHGIVVQRDFLKVLPNIVGERVPLQQVLLNLIMNAVDAMGSLMGRTRELSIKTQLDESDSVVITVADAGVGLDPQNMERIFEAFFTTKPQGMGMGLSICRSIVEAHGGRIWATPRIPHGTIFHVQLPVSC